MKMQLSLLVVFVFLVLAAAPFGRAASASQASGSGSAAATTTATPTSDTGETDHAAAMVPGKPGQLFQVTIAAYLLDTAGFHALDERINGEGLIEAGDAGVVHRANAVLAATAWPYELQTQVDPLKETLGLYAEALANDDVEAAKPLAAEAHELQHDLSHAIEHWADKVSDHATTAIDEQDQLFQVTIATYLLDTAGFHALDERINGEGVIEAGDAGVVHRVNTVLAVTAWPEELQDHVDPLRDALSSYAEALANDDAEAAKPLATQAHELQHDLSHAAEHWVGEKTGSAEPGQAHDASDG